MGYGRLGIRGIVGRFFPRLEEAFGRGWASMIGWLNEDSDQAQEDYRWLGAPPMMREWLGPRLQKRMTVNEYIIANKVFEASENFDIEDLRRDKTSQIMTRVDELADRTAEHWEKLLSEILKDGDDATLGKCYDGQKFFDSDHETQDSGQQRNDFAAGQVASLDVADPTAPTSEEWAVIIPDMIAKFYGFLDEQGEPINGTARSFLVMVKPSMWAQAFAGATRDTLASGASNPVATLREKGYMIDVVANPRLAIGSNAWANEFGVFRTDGNLKPFIMQSESGVETQALGEDSEYAIKNNQVLFGVKAVRNVGYGMWQHALKGTLS